MACSFKTKQIQVSEETHKEILMIKASMGFKSTDETIRYLIEKGK